MSGMDAGGLMDLNGTGIFPDNETFLRFFPTSRSTSAGAAAAAAAPPPGGGPGNVHVYVWIFFSLLVFLLTLLIISLHRLKNVITSSSPAVPDCSSEGGSSFTNMEICSISSRRSTISSLSN